MSPASELLYRFVEDSAGMSAEDLDQLIAALRASPADVVRLREQLMLDDLLAQKLTVDRRNFLAQVEQRIADFERGEEEIDNQVADLRALAHAELERPVTQPRQSPWLWAGLVSAAALLLAAAFVFSPRLRGDRQPIATVVELQGEAVIVGEEGDTSLAVGTNVSTSQAIEVAEGGSVTLQYADQTTITIVQGPVVLRRDRQTGAKQVQIEQGEVAASVAKQTRGPMLFQTPHAVAQVLGTELRLTVDHDSTRLEVTEGTVRFTQNASGKSVDVLAREVGEVRGNQLSHAQLMWPENRETIAFLLPFNFGDGRSVARNPESDHFRDTPLVPQGAVEFDPVGGLQLAGGWCSTDERGNDIAALCKQKGEFSLETILTPHAADAEGTIVQLTNSDGQPSFALVQRQNKLIFRVQPTAAPAEPAELNLGDIATDRPVHVTVTYRDGLLAGYLDGKEVAQRTDVHGHLDAWSEGPLTLGADSKGNNLWRGTLQAVIVHRQALTPSEVSENVRSYRGK